MAPCRRLRRRKATRILLLLFLISTSPSPPLSRSLERPETTELRVPAADPCYERSYECKRREQLTSMLLTPAFMVHLVRVYSKCDKAVRGFRLRIVCYCLHYTHCHWARSIPVHFSPGSSPKVLRTEKTGTFPCFQGEKSVYMCKNNDSQGLLLLPLCL